MSKTSLCLLVSAISVSVVSAAAGPAPDQEDVDQVLTAFHAAAAAADGELYFSLFADDAIFIGTDAAERWTVTLLGVGMDLTSSGRPA